MGMALLVHWDRRALEKGTPHPQHPERCWEARRPADWSEQHSLPAGESLRLLDDDTAHLQVAAVQGGGSGRRRQGLAPHPGHRSVLRPARHLRGLVCFSTGSDLLMPLLCSRRFAKEAACPDLQTFQPRHPRLSGLQRVHNRNARRSEGEKPVCALCGHAPLGAVPVLSGSGTLARARKGAGERHVPALPEAADRVHGELGRPILPTRFS